MGYIKLFEAWYRGYTSNTIKLSYVWLTENKNQAYVYSIINNATYGGGEITKTFKINLKGKRILDLNHYDMDDRFSESELENFLEEIEMEYEVDNLFDIMEDDIPLSRLVNKILKELMYKYDGIKIEEDGNKTICVNINILV